MPVMQTRRRTPASFIAMSRLRVPKENKLVGLRLSFEPSELITTSCPSTAARREAPSLTSARTSLTPAGSAADSGCRTAAVISWPRATPCETSSRPVGPVAPMTRIFICCSSMGGPRNCRSDKSVGSMRLASGGFYGQSGGNGLGNRSQISLAFSQLHQEILASEGLCVFEYFGSADVATVGLLQSRFHGIGQVGRQNLFMNAGPCRRIANREDHFAALEKIARHPVRRSKIDFVVATVGKVEDARVLEEATHDGANANSL